MSDDKHCANCYYSIFSGLDRWCLHPDHPIKLYEVLRHCDNWIDVFEKHMGSRRKRIQRPDKDMRLK